MFVRLVLIDQCVSAVRAVEVPYWSAYVAAVDVWLRQEGSNVCETCTRRSVCFCSQSGGGAILVCLRSSCRRVTELRGHRLKIIQITEAEIKSVIRSLKPKNSSGYGEINSKILKTCASDISHPLTFICNHSIYTDIFPDRLSIAVIKPRVRKETKLI
jgi:hypothetical protein